MKRLIDANALRDIWLCLEGNDFKASDFVYSIDAQPTIDAEPVRHGKWMGTVCTACGESTSFYYDCDYCPHCGARMDEE